jgi:hypothetical protein
MNALPRLFVALLIVGGLTLATSASAAASAHPHASTPIYYLALGDSVGAGFQNPTIPTDRACTDAANDATGSRGYNCLFLNKLRQLNPGIKYQSLALTVSTSSDTGEDSCSFKDITNCAGATTRVDGPRATRPPSTSTTCLS